MKADLTPTFLHELAQVYSALRPQPLSAEFLCELAQVYGAFRPQPLSVEFLTALARVHADLPSASDAILQFLASRFGEWRSGTREFVRARLAELAEDDPLRCPISLFRTIDSGRLETAHTRALAWLLHPAREHGFGTALMGALLRRLSRGRGPEGISVSRVESEYPIQVAGGKGRLDVLAEGEWGAGTRLSWALVIEAKVDAGEGDAQLQKYETWLEPHAGGREVFRVFLTPAGAEPETGAEDWEPLSFLELVRCFRSVYGRLRSAPGFHFLRFYLAGVLQDVCGWPFATGADAADPYALAAYLKSVADSEGG
ncbi:MAG: PD-(D/E)XK nuclease family protein [Planctomycetes bacterium]|nr:PD-(D/E)XK nuclease family protein [Planctomycetota bacterium]